MDVFVFAIARVDHAPSRRIHRNSILDQYAFCGGTVFTRLGTWLGRNGAGRLNGGSDRGVGTKTIQQIWYYKRISTLVYTILGRTDVQEEDEEIGCHNEGRKKGIMIQYTTVKVDRGLVWQVMIRGLTIII